jgi:very-short-patch-repair endonuclease
LPKRSKELRQAARQRHLSQNQATLPLRLGETTMATLARRTASAHRSCEERASVVRRIAGIIRASAAAKVRSGSASLSESLWYGLQHGLVDFTFRRDCVIDGCRIDFLCIEVPLAIRIDGERQAPYEAFHTVLLAQSGFRVLRFWSDEIAQRLDGVVAEIFDQLQAENDENAD